MHKIIFLITLFLSVNVHANNPFNESGVSRIGVEVFNYPANHFSFNLNGEDLDLVGFINGRLGTSFAVDKKIDLTFKQIKYIAAQDYLGLYGVHLAYHSNITVHAALPATYAEITPSFTISSLTQQNVNFYETHLNVSIDSDKYGIFDRASVITINSMTP